MGLVVGFMYSDGKPVPLGYGLYFFLNEQFHKLFDNISLKRRIDMRKTNQIYRLIPLYKPPPFIYGMSACLIFYD